jgi:DNA (cytosine-5)-methyltransferase 1
MTFPLDGFDVIHASPPCQAYSNAQKIRGRSHPDLIAPLRARIRAEAPGVPYVIENVQGAPLIAPTLLCGLMFPGLRVYRHRLFECDPFYFDEPHIGYGHPYEVAKMGRPPRPGQFMHVVGNFSDVRAAREAMGIDWMTRDELREAIPPAYTEYIGARLMAALVPA